MIDGVNFGKIHSLKIRFLLEQKSWSVERKLDTGQHVKDVIFTLQAGVVCIVARQLDHVQKRVKKHHLTGRRDIRKEI